MRDQDLLGVGAGENVIRLLPPLIVSEAEIDEGVRRFEAALEALEQARAGSEPMVRHFLDLADIDGVDAAVDPRREPAAQGRAAHAVGDAAARRPGARDDLR